MLFAVIVGCEIGFWLLVGAGLACRYLLRRRRASTVLLAAVPVLDLVLLIATVADLLARHAVAGPQHGLAAVYLGGTVVFGRGMVRWADRWFAYRFAGGPRPPKLPKSGPVRARYEWREWGKAVLAGAIAAALLGLMALVLGDLHRSAALLSWLPRIGLVLAIWLIWPLTTVPGALRGAGVPAAEPDERDGRSQSATNPERGDRSGSR
ncbi:hypothetical protein [Actinocatenispora sera]|uniref:Membrane protein YmcC n=1 Tax=Actinocatenispora sera TaxID=390989 RepID=A0A810L9V1_9ACTN|nr:hypothetical protein [Actinocatenispora sera]BCJ31372.1 hypothetical protein Asera_54800 [Actinocatenispora sera]